MDNSGPGWAFNKTGEIEDPEPNEPETREREQTERDAADKIKNPKIPDAVKQASAETAALMWDELLQMIGVPIVNYKFSKKFTDAEKAAVMEKDIEFKAFEDIEPELQYLKHKWTSNLKKRDAKILNIPLNENETKRVKTAFYNHFKVTDTAMSPGWLLAFTLTSILVDRTIEVATD